MIFGNFKTSPEKQFLPKVIQQALDYLRDTDFSLLENKTYPIQGDDMFSVIQEYQTELKNEKTAEQHRKYIDVQYMISGKEIIGVGFDHPNNEVIDEYVEEKDRIKYGSIVNETDLVIVSGMYAVLFPEDIHRPGCQYLNKNKVRKVVVKILVNLIKQSS